MLHLRMCTLATIPQVKALYARLDAAVFYCSTKKASFGLHAYVAHVSAMQQTTRSIWGDLEADDREAATRLTSSWMWPSPAMPSPALRHTAQKGRPGARGSP